MSLFDLPKVSFIDDLTLDDVKKKLVSAYETRFEEITGNPLKLAKADPERLKLEAAAVYLYQLAAYIQRAGEQNLLATSYGPYLDNLAALKGVKRLPAARAVTTMRFSLSLEQNADMTIPKGTMATNGAGVYFATVKDTVIPRGSLSAEVGAECTEAGSAGSDIAEGEIKYLVNMLPWVVKAENITETQGGADEETDEHLAERVYLAPASYSTAGARDAYIYHTKTYSQAIADVNVSSPEPCEVAVRVILEGGVLPDEAFLSGLYEHLNDDAVRPLADNLTVAAPDEAEYDLDVTYYIARSRAAGADGIKADIEKAIEDYIVWQSSEIGRDINPSELISAVMKAGAKRADVKSPTFEAVSDISVGVINNKKITYGGLEDD